MPTLNLTVLDKGVSQAKKIKEDFITKVNKNLQIYRVVQKKVYDMF